MSVHVEDTSRRGTYTVTVQNIVTLSNATKNVTTEIPVSDVRMIGQ